MAERAGQGLSRRGLLGAAGLTGIAGAGLTGYGVGRGTAPPPTRPTARSSGDAILPFYAEHQSGVVDEPQAHVVFLAVDLLPGVGRDGLRRLLRQWSDDAARLQEGRPTLGDPQPELAAPPERLSVTIGLGRSALVAAGLEPAAPGWLTDLPRFGVDRLETRWSGGDVLAQVCCDDAITLSHAVRALTIDLAGIARIRWQQIGFRRPGTSRTTMRTLMGQVDGTVQPTPDTFSDLVWTGADAPSWLRGGTSLVLRRIRMNLRTWDELDPVAKEQVIGRRLASGAPLTGEVERDHPDLQATVGGLPVIPDFAHIRHAAPVGARERILRRPYNYDDGPVDGTPDSGLLFAAYQRDPVAQFVPIQQRLDKADLLNVWTTPVGSAVFAIPPGAREGGYVGESLLEA